MFLSLVHAEDALWCGAELGISSPFFAKPSRSSYQSADDRRDLDSVVL